MALFTTSTKPATAAGGELPDVVRKAMSKVTEIGSLPEVTTRIVQVVEDPNATAKQIHAVVRTDPALATKILKVVNSAFYGLPSQIASLERAILMLGMSAVRNLALAASLSKLIKDGEICPGFSTRDLWRHSIAVGVCARALAAAGRSPQADEAFVAGLVHDMGLIVSQQLFPAEMRTVAETCQREPQNFRAVEQSVIGADHQTFGGVLAGKWKFPPGLRNAIAYHHDPSSLQPEFQKIAATIYLADAMCCRGRHGFWLTAQIQEHPAWMLELLGLAANNVEQIAAELPDHVTEAQQIFATH